MRQANFSGTFTACLVCTCAALLLAAPGAHAGGSAPILNTNVPDRPDWVETPIASAPAYSSAHLLPVDMPPSVSVHVGIDPETVSVGADNVVRYVVVMRNKSGSESAFFEGIRCDTREIKSYARHGGSGDWIMTANPTWRSFTDPMPSQHAQIFARQAACSGGINLTQKDILDTLRNGTQAINRNGHGNQMN